ncbi:MAG: helix-hairpin-helix domain-containing protein [Phycisphaerales bacterium]|nr:helix-hairpin-helix domain-containing protein [Phycisphaerales bacterium]
MTNQESTPSDWSKTPAAMVSTAILGIASISGLIWSMTTTAATPTVHTQQIIKTGQPPPAKLLVNINTAGTNQLQLLPSIGPKLAQRIIDDRTENGQFKSLKDLDRVKGIGPKTLKRLADWVTITTP